LVQILEASAFRFVHNILYSVSTDNYQGLKSSFKNIFYHLGILEPVGAGLAGGGPSLALRLLSHLRALQGLPVSGRSMTTRTIENRVKTITQLFLILYTCPSFC
jgi:hypothetical protein